MSDARKIIDIDEYRPYTKRVKNLKESLDLDTKKLQALMSPLKGFIQKEFSSFLGNVRLHLSLDVEYKRYNVPYILIYDLTARFSKAFGIFKEKILNVQVLIFSVDRLKEDNYGFKNALIRFYSTKFFSDPSNLKLPEELATSMVKEISIELERYREKISNEFNIPLKKIIIEIH